jgi:hypothetical protein
VCDRPLKVSRSTFLKRYSECWSSVLPFRNTGQGKRCATCAELDQEYSQALTKQEKDEIATRKTVHIAQVMQDRAVDTRGIKVSESDAARLTRSSSDLLLKVGERIQHDSAKQYFSKFEDG